MNHPLLVVIMSSMITGCIGGVRDVLCNDVPLLFRSELHACVSGVTFPFYIAGLRYAFNAEVVTLATFGVGLAFRLLAIRHRWEMPKFVYSRDGF